MATKDKITILDNFNAFVQKRMREKELSIRELARRADISPSYLSHLFKGESNIPSSEILIRIAKALDLKPPELILIEAGRIPSERPELIGFMRVLGSLSEKDKKQIMDIMTALQIRSELQK